MKSLWRISIYGIILSTFIYCFGASTIKAEIAHYPEIHIDSITPENMYIGQDIDVTITGKGFDEHTRVILIPEDNSAIASVDITGYVSDFVVIDEIAYITNNDGLKIVDISNFFNPKTISSLKTSHSFSQIDVRENNVYIVDQWKGLIVIDINNISMPIEKQFINIPDYIHNFFIMDHYVFVVDFQYSEEKGRMIIFDISNPFNPQRISSVNIPGAAHDISIVGNIAYVADGEEGLQVIDIHDLSYPKIIGSIKTQGNAYRISVNNDLAYIQTEENSLQIIDIKDSLNPIYIQTVEFHYPRVYDNLAYMPEDEGVSIVPISYSIPDINFSDSKLSFKIPAHKFEGRYQLKIYNPEYDAIKNVYFKGPVDISNQTISANSDSITIPFTFLKNTTGKSYQNYTLSLYPFDQNLIPQDNIQLELSENHNFIKIKPGRNSFGSTLISLALTNGHELLIDTFKLSVEFNEIEINSISPETFQIGKQIEINLAGKGFDENTHAILLPAEDNVIIGNCNNIKAFYDDQFTIVDNVAYIPNGSLSLIDITSPSSPNMITSLELPNNIHCITSYDHKVYVAGAEKLYILDISDPVEPKINGSVSLEYFTLDITIIGDTAYLATHDMGIQIVNIKDSLHPTFLQIMDTPVNAISIYKIDNNLYAAGSEGMSIFDCTLSKPVLLGEIESVSIGYASDIFVDHDKAYMVQGAYGLKIVDVSDSYHPKIEESVYFSGSATGVNAHNQILYVATDGGYSSYCPEGGLHIVDVIDSYNPRIIASYKKVGNLGKVIVNDDMIYVLGDQGLSILQKPSEIEITNYSDSSLSLKIPPQKIAGDMQLKLYNQQYEDTKIINFKGLTNISDQIIPGKTEIISIPFTLNDLYSGISFEDYTITVNSLDQQLISDDNIHLNHEQNTITIKPNHNMFGNTVINFSITNGQELFIDRFNVDIEFQEIEIDSITPNDFIIGYHSDLNIAGKGFDKNTEAVFIPDNKNIVIGSVKIPGNANYVFLTQDTAYVIDGNLHLVDISDATYPKMVSSFETAGLAKKVLVENQIAYVADGHEGLQIIDVSDPKHPNKIGFYDQIENAISVGVKDQTIYVADAKIGLIVIDVSNPFQPDFIKTIESNNTIKDVLVMDKTLFVVSNGLFQTYDVSESNNPQISGSVDYGYNSDFDTTLSASKKTALIAYHYGLSFIDINDLYHPKLIEKDSTSLSHGGIVIGETLFATCNKQELKLFDVNDSNDIRLIGNIKLPESPTSLAIKDNLIYITDHTNGLSIIPSPQKLEITDISETTLSLKISHHTISDIMQLKVYNQQYAYTQTIEINSPIEIPDQFIPGNSEISFIPLTLNELYSNTFYEDYTITFHSSNQMLVSDDNVGLGFDKERAFITIKPCKDRFGTTIISMKIANEKESIIEQFELTVNFQELNIKSVHIENCATDECYPEITVNGQGFDKNSNIMFIPEGDNKVVGSVEILMDHFQHISVDKNLAYVLCQSTLKVVDVTNPFNPIITKTLYIPGSPRETVIEGKIAYIDAWNRGIQIVDLRDPFNPSIIGSIDKLYPNDIAVYNQFVYVANDEGLQIIDAKYASTPIIDSTIETLKPVHNVTVEGQFIYMIVGNELQIRDFRDFSKSIISSINIPGYYYRDLVVQNQIAYLANKLTNGDTILTIIDARNSSHPKLITSIDTPGSVNHINLVNKFVYILGSNEIQIINVSDIFNPKMVKSIKTNSYPDQTENIYVKNNLIYTSVYNYKNHSTRFNITPLPIFIHSENISIEDSLIIIHPTLKLTGNYQLIVFNPQYDSSTHLFLDFPVEISEISDQIIPGNSDYVSISFTLNTLISDVSYSDYTISFYSLNQQLISNDNMYLELLENQYHINLKPTLNQFGTTQIELLLTNGYVSTTEQFQISIDFPDINIDSVKDDNFIVDGVFERTLVGQGFDFATRLSLYYDQAIGFADTGRIKDVDVIDKKAYVITSKKFYIIDINNYYNPKILGTLEIDDSIQSIFIVDKIAYIACSDSAIKIIDISNSFNPNFLTPFTVNDYTGYLDKISIFVLENKAYITDSYDILNIFNIYDDHTFERISSFEELDGWDAKDVFVVDQKAYIAERHGFLHTIDVNDVYHPQKINTIATADNAESVVVIDNIAYVTTHSGLQIFDVRDPANPKTKSFVKTPGKAENLIISNQKAYVSNQNESLQIIDISDLSAPTIIGSIGSSCNALAVNDDMIFIGGDSGLSIIPLPVDIKDISLSENSLSLTIPQQKYTGNYQLTAFNPQHQDSIKINRRYSIEISDIPDQSISANSGIVNIPFTIHKLNNEISIEDYTITVQSFNQSLIPDSTIRLEISDNQLFFSVDPIFNQFGTADIRLMVTDGNAIIIENCLLTVEFPKIQITSILPDSQVISDNQIELNFFQNGFDKNTQAILYCKPTYNFDNHISLMDTLNKCRIVEAANQKAYVTNGNRLAVIDISDPQHHTVIHFFELSEYVYDLIAADEVLYAIITGENGGIQKIRFRDGANSPIIEFLPLNNVFKTTVSNQIAYVAPDPYSIEIIDINDFSNPKTINSFNCSGFITAMDMKDQMLFIAMESQGISIVNLSDPKFPKTVSFVNITEHIYEISIVENIAYIACGEKGLKMIDISDYNDSRVIGCLGCYNDYYYYYYNYLADDGYYSNDYSYKGNFFDLAVFNGILYSINDHSYLTFEPLPQAIKTIDFSKNSQSFTFSPPRIPGEYALKVYTPQYENTKLVTFTFPFTLSEIPDQAIYPDIQEAEFSLIITSKSYNSKSYTVTAHSGTPWIIPDENIRIEGSGLRRTIKVTPAKHQYGVAPIHITVNDGKVSVMESFDLSIKFPQLNYKWIDSYSLSDQMSTLTQITDSNGYTYQSDRTQHCINKYYNGELVFQWGQKGNDNGSFDSPLGMAVDQSGFIYVVDSGNKRVQVFTPYGKYITTIGEYGSGKLNHPEYISILDDIIYVSDDDNKSIQAFKKVDYTEGITKAIIIAGGGPKDNSIWLETKTCADLAYRSLIYQGLNKDTIYYLSSDTENEFVDNMATIENIERAITQWAVGTRITDNQDELDICADSLIIYLVDHGGDGQFLVDISQKEILRTDILNQWLNVIQESIPGKLVIIYDACNSGSFIPSLSNYANNRDRIIITSSSSSEPAYFMGYGGHSFSNYFWASIYNGRDIKDAFETAQNAMSITRIASQSPQITIDGNDITNEIVDINGVQNVFIGNGNNIQTGLPVISDITSHQIISDSSSAEITVSGVRALDGISQVWAQIISSNFTSVEIDKPILHFPTIQLENRYDGTYSGTYHGFSKEGTYQIAVYAEDNRGLTSYPMLTSLAVKNPLGRRAIIIMGNSGSESDTMVMNNAQAAAHALKSQGYFDEDIEMICSDSMNLAHLETKLLNYSEEQVQDIVLYMIGDGDTTKFSFSQTDALSKDTLQTWLDQMNNDIRITIVYDAPYSFQYLESIKPAHENCILISSTSQENHYAYCLMDGLISFSRYFWDRISNGDSLYTSYQKTNSAIDTFFNQKQSPSIVYGENNALDYRFGYGFRYGDIDPLIGSVSAQFSPYNNYITIDATNVISIQPIEKVVAVVIAPDHPSADENINIIELNPIKNTTNYTAIYNGLSIPGKYNISICAIDTSGNMSTPKATYVRTSECSHIISVLQQLVGIKTDVHIPSHSKLNKNGPINLKEAIHMMQSM